MSKRIVSDLFVNFYDAKGAVQSAEFGDEVELTAPEEKRLDEAGALAPTAAELAAEARADAEAKAAEAKRLADIAAAEAKNAAALAKP